MLTQRVRPHEPLLRCPGPMRLTFYLDEYNPDLALDYFVVAGVLIRDHSHSERALREFEALAQCDPRFNRKAARWEPAQLEKLADLLLSCELLPVAWFVRVDDLLCDLLRTHARAHRKPSSGKRRFGGGQWLIGQVLAQTMIMGCVHWVLNLGRIDGLSVVMDRGNLRPEQKDAIKHVVAEFTGPECFAEIERSRDMRAFGIVNAAMLPRLRGRCAWTAPQLRFEGSGILLRVADGYTALVSRFLNGDEGSKEVMNRLDGSYACRHRTWNAPFLYNDGTVFVLGFLDKNKA